MLSAATGSSVFLRQHCLRTHHLRCCSLLRLHEGPWQVGLGEASISLPRACGWLGYYLSPQMTS